jgi:beta-xylosidase
MRLLLVVVFATLLAGCSAGPRLALERAASGPVLDLDFPDPFLLPVGRTLFAYATNTVRDGERIHVQVSHSPDGVHWAAPAEAMPTLPGWAKAPDGDVWAPEVLKLGERYVLYFAARHATLRRPDGLTLCVGAAVSHDPGGPFAPQETPLSCEGPVGVIDPSPLNDRGRLWLLVKTDGNCCRLPVRFLALPLSADGLHVAGEPVPVEGVRSDTRWTGDVVEAPQMRRRDGRWVLFFSGNDYGGPDYGIGYATCEGPTGPCIQAAENPIVRSTPELRGPGHETLLETGGRSYLGYHAWRTAPGWARQSHRAMYITPLKWKDGRPHAQDLPPDATPPPQAATPSSR